MEIPGKSPGSLPDRGSRSIFQCTDPGTWRSPVKAGKAVLNTAPEKQGTLGASLKDGRGQLARRDRRALGESCCGVKASKGKGRMSSRSHIANGGIFNSGTGSPREVLEATLVLNGLSNLEEVL